MLNEFQAAYRDCLEIGGVRPTPFRVFLGLGETVLKSSLDLRSMDTRLESVSSFNALRDTGLSRVSMP
jgi:hypothetical protein